MRINLVRPILIVFALSLAVTTPAFANEKVHKDSHISFKTNDGREFSISESGWYLINKTNAAPKNATFSSVTASAIAELEEFSKFNPIYNYLVNPETIEGTDGDHVLVTVASTDGLITEENLEETKSFLRDYWSARNGHLKHFEFELVDRRKLPNGLKSGHMKVRFKNITEEYLTMQSPLICVVVSFSSGPNNVEQYRRIMFEIIDSIELNF